MSTTTSQPGRSIPPSPSSTLSTHLHHALLSIHQNPSPHIPNPPSCPKRASVALILRIRPHSTHPAPGTQSPPQNTDSTPFTTATSSPTLLTHPTSPPPPHPLPSSSPSTGQEDTTPALLQTFFHKPWVQHGTPEVLFIKRASRPTDRWSSHVALPGGRRDPEDEDDKVTAIRETWEEIGLDLKGEGCVYVGKLPERVVRMSWGRVPIMVLSPYIFLLTTPSTSPSYPSLTLQPTEISSTHYVPLSTLLSPSLRTFEYIDVSGRFASRAPNILRKTLGLFLGKMRFSAIRLLPSESLVCIEAEEYFPFQKEGEGKEKGKWEGIGEGKGVMGIKKGFPSPLEYPRPLLLWGLTLGMLADFLEHLPPHNAISLWKYPTFTAPDIKLLIHLLTRRLKARNNAILRNSSAVAEPEAGDGTTDRDERVMREARRRGSLNQTAIDMDTEAIAPVSPITLDNEDSESTTGEKSPWFVGWSTDKKQKRPSPPPAYAVGVLMNGYYDRARLAVWMAMLLRMVVVLGFGWGIVRRWRAIGRGRVKRGMV